MNTPKHLCHWSLALLGSGLSLLVLPALAQTTGSVSSRDAVPEFTVPVLEGVDPSSVKFDDRILERDRSEGSGSAGRTPAPQPASQNGGFDVGASSSGSSSGGGGSAGGGGPSIFQGGPQISVPSFPSGSSGSSGGSDGGVDVNVSVNGVPMPSGSSSGMPGGMPGSSGEGIPGSSSPSGSSGDGDGGFDVDVNVNVIGKQMPGLPGIPGLPGSSSGAGMPSVGMPGSSSGGGTPNMGGLPGSGSGSSSGNSRGSSNGNGSGNGNSGSGSMGTIGSNNGSGSTNGSMGTVGSSSGSATGTGTGGGAGGTRSGKRSVLDARLDESFGVFDGMIIGERERAQNEANAAGSSVMGSGSSGADGGDGEFGEGSAAGGVMVATGPMNSTGGGMLPEGARAREGDFSNQNQEAFPPPEDIPSGDNDDVVARQLREAAMHEPDPELREKLWDEYRKYTGLSQ